MRSHEKKEYGLFTLISAVIGTVIGSGIFFKSEEILKLTDGEVLTGLLAFLVGGGIMLLTASSFALLSAEGGSGGGLVGYAEKMCGSGYARFVALFSADFYLPSMAATLAYVSGGYFCALVGREGSDILRVASSSAFLVMLFAANTLAPRGAGRFQVAATVMKLLPLLAVGAMGCAALVGGRGAEISTTLEPSRFMPALLSAAFAYEGWIAVTALGGEVKNEGRSMPAALVLGSTAVLAVYLFYYFGVVGASENGSSVEAFGTIFGASGGRLMLLFVTISCLGALNGISMSAVRGHFILSEYLGAGGSDRFFAEISEKTGIPVLSGIMGLLVSEGWLFLRLALESVMGSQAILDPAEASISVMYAIYLPILLMMTVRRGEKGLLRGYVIPLVAVLASLVMALAAPLSFGTDMVIFIFAVAAVSVAVLCAYRR